LVPDPFAVLANSFAGRDMLHEMEITR
jgi:hypothetical protein